ncbi:hypothetical protein HBI56_151220 [Parastagonospora nodorum]|uniref:Uncharacterized protein n=2 Tax=Phaeosphaeria nodorum (strain SN15 / ATCC MYA-4574 / FGSC 10173) TaxID=321614 RepID=A0A7U2I835_PHANO|nr:hypothetical protein SNOG_12881 [Parastagonospora nodorum SN15]KAH3907951.1 hypothetical protein HBH56_183300 [Parastagonospora nodorum]EAT79681.1 hypothetical protein SNOG_12881 [Parastagonospora nodorum SN15]KAH3926010.1 hypothetical protein HBH54_172450 [Parastagonospora nodorum]KAH3944869.1 hypothetical protein HBH53_152470 [Parastagonospora nodorum]KAH3962464.1 hypothetical protein HBH52_223950 [Parastagonospora nodorum]
MASHSYLDFQFHPVWALPGRPPKETQYTTAFQMFQVALPLPRDFIDVPQSYSITTTTGEQMQRFVRIGTPHINFRKCYLNYFEHTWRTDTPARQLQALFKFTTVLMHELTHAFANFVWNGMHPHGDSSEPRFQYESRLQELGFEWEKWFFIDNHMTDPVEFYKMQHSQPLLPMELLILSDQILTAPIATQLGFFRITIPRRLA